MSVKNIEQALELLARKIDVINKTTNFPDNTLDKVRDLLVQQERKIK